ncbi:MAG: type IX secretion system protein PorQ, partial [Muribaculaceae bacterium]|nr:type IX secretion system protein PorQ [Muribaculaceae bacterium]
MKLLHSLILTLAIVVGVASAAAQDGSTGYQFLNLTSSSRIYALGGMNISTVEDDINTIDQNPALLGPEMSMQTSVNYMRYVGESNFAGVKYAHSSGERGAWAASIQYLGYGSMKQTDETGTVLGTFSASDVVFAGAYSHDITDRLRGGIALKGAYSAYESYSAFALATDLGINYFDPERDLSLSFVVANLGGQVKKFNNRYDRLPIDLRLGWTQSFGSLPLRFSVTAWNLTKWKLPYYD